MEEYSFSPAGPKSGFILLSEEEEEDHHDLPGRGEWGHQGLYQAHAGGQTGVGLLQPHSSKQQEEQHTQEQKQEEEQRRAQEQQELDRQLREQKEEEERLAAEKQKQQARQEQKRQKEQEQLEQMRAEMRELQAARLPKPWSADDINPTCMPPAATSWLLPPSYTTSTKDAAEAIEAAALLANSSSNREPKVIDLRKMSRQQLEAASYKHNIARNIEDPGKEAMEGIQERVGVLNPSCEVYPITIGGNPRVNEYSRAWTALLRGKALGPTVTPTPAAPKAQPAEERKSLTRPKEAPRTNYSAFGEYTHEQKTFNSLLASYLDVAQPLVLPLLALGNPVVDLKGLFLKVAKDCGGWVATCRSNKWPDIAQELQRGTQHSSILKEIYAYYLLPVEVGMARTSGSMRPASVNQWLESKVTERKNAGSEESRRPSPGNVSRTVQVADEGMQEWAETFGSSSAMPYLAHELILQVASDPLAYSSRSALASHLQHLIKSTHGCSDIASLATTSQNKGGNESGASADRGAGTGGGRGSSEMSVFGDERSDEDGSGAFAGSGRKRAKWNGGDLQHQQHQQQQLEKQKRRRQEEEQDVGGVWLEREQKLLQKSEEEVAGKVDVLLALARSLRQKDTRPPFLGAPQPDVMSHFKTQFELDKGYPFRSSSQPPKPPPLTRQAQQQIATSTAPKPASTPASSRPQVQANGLTSRQQPLSSSSHAPTTAPASDHQPAGRKEFAISLRGTSQEQEPPSKRARHRQGYTPKCGTCHTCLHPSMKKPCQTNRERISAGLEPIVKS